MSQCRILGYIVACAVGLVVCVGCGAGCAGVPRGYVKPARVAVVVVVESFVGIWRSDAAIGGASHGHVRQVWGGQRLHDGRLDIPNGE